MQTVPKGLLSVHRRPRKRDEGNISGFSGKCILPGKTPSGGKKTDRDADEVPAAFLRLLQSPLGLQGPEKDAKGEWKINHGEGD